MDHQQKFFELRAAIKAESFPKALSIATELEKELPEDEDVVKCKCVCLINMGRFEEAFAVASKAGGILAFEGAYCLYQMNRNQECLAAIVSSSAATSLASTNLKALEAQVLYKLSRASEAADVYQALVDGSGGDGHGECLEGSELLSNTLAAYAAAGRGGEGFSKLSSQVAEFIEEDGGADASAVPEDDEDKSYEIAYNAACALLDAGRYAKAAELLQVAEARCKQQGAFTSTAPTPDGGDGMLSEEGATITCQRAVGLLKACGGSGSGAAQAMALCAGVMKHGKQQQQQASLSSASSQQHGSGGDLAVPLALATNTLAVARRDRELFDSHKRLRAAASELVEAKMTPSQVYSLHLNKSLLLLHMNKFDECVAAAQDMLASSSSVGAGGRVVGPSLVLLSVKLKKAAPHHLRDAPKTAIAEALVACEGLAKDASKGGFFKAAAEAELFGCQLLLLRGDVKGACEHLEKNCKSPLLWGGSSGSSGNGGGAAAPAVAATVADMKERFLGDHSGALKTLDAALAQGNKDGGGGSEDGTTSSSSRARLVLAVARRKVALGEHGQGAKLLEQLLGEQERGEVAMEAEERLACLAHLVLAHSWIDPEKAEASSASLPSPQALLKQHKQQQKGGGGDDDDDDDDDEDEDDDEEDLDPLVLEEAPLPRTASSKVRRLIVVDKKQAKKLAAAAAAQQQAEASGGDGDDSLTASLATMVVGGASSSAKKRAHEKRAAKHLAKLVASGKSIDLRNPPKPDPLRWVPKKLRSAKGRKGMQSKGGGGKISGAQGVSTEGSKDAAKLDAYARAQAKKEADAAKAAAEEAGHTAKRGPWRRMK